MNNNKHSDKGLNAPVNVTGKPKHEKSPVKLGFQLANVGA